ncbi:MAG: glycosyltransferase [Planctomycetota bacterium]
MSSGLMRVCHVISDLQVGGAQVMLHKLLSRLDRAQFDSRVISLTESGPMAEPLQAIGVPIEVCHMSRGIPSPSSLFRLRRQLSQPRPDVIQTWLFHSDLLGGAVSKWTRLQVPVVWNIRMSSLCSTIDKRSTRWTVKLCALLSRHLPARIIVNSQAGRSMNQEIGYAPDKLEVIPNGFDTDCYRPSTGARRTLRGELGIASDAALIGLVGRYHPHKDHDTFLKAAGQVLASRPDTHFLLCGDGIDKSNGELRERIQRAGPMANFHLLGRRDDLPTIQAGLDIAVSSSVTEGFPNVIGEAMSCGVPCVVTDAGGSSEVVGDTGRIVPCGDARALADACLEILAMPSERRRRLGELARQRVVEQFSLERVTELYADLWQRVAGVARDTAPRTARRAA